jgi:hypothetical protein
MVASALFDCGGCLTQAAGGPTDSCASPDSPDPIYASMAGKVLWEPILDRKFQALDPWILDLRRFDLQRLIQEYNVT